MVSLEDRLKNVHPNARKKVRPTAKYVSDGLSEFMIKQDKVGHYFIERYRGGRLPERIKSTYTSFRECENALIQYLESKNKWGRAIYPDVKSRGN